jgi:hypothetical protein
MTVFALLLVLVISGGNGEGHRDAGLGVEELDEASEVLRALQKQHTRNGADNEGKPLERLQQAVTDGSGPASAHGKPLLRQPLTENSIAGTSLPSLCAGKKAIVG